MKYLKLWSSWTLLFEELHHYTYKDAARKLSDKGYDDRAYVLRDHSNYMQYFNLMTEYKKASMPLFEININDGGEDFIGDFYILFDYSVEEVLDEGDGEGGDWVDAYYLYLWVSIIPSNMNMLKEYYKLFGEYSSDLLYLETDIMYDLSDIPVVSMNYKNSGDYITNITNDNCEYDVYEISSYLRDILKGNIIQPYNGYENDAEVSDHLLRSRFTKFL